MLSWSIDSEWMFYIICFIFLAAFIIFAFHSDRVRRKTLRKREDGTYVWFEWYGGQRTSEYDPSRPGGEWYGDTDGGGDGGD